MRTPDYEKKARDAVDRLDVLEDELPHSTCQARGCGRQAGYEHAGAFGSRWLCSRHRALYRKHDAILKWIRSL